MRTTVDLDDELIKQAFSISGIKKKTELLEAGLRALIRREAARGLMDLGGKIPGMKAPRRRRWPYA